MPTHAAGETTGLWGYVLDVECTIPLGTIDFVVIDIRSIFIASASRGFCPWLERHRCGKGRCERQMPNVLPTAAIPNFIIRRHHRNSIGTEILAVQVNQPVALDWEERDPKAERL